MAYSLAFFKFKKSLEREIRNYWSIAIATEFSNNWLQNLDQQQRITQIAQNVAPFSYVDIKSSDYIKHLPTVVEYSRENALVNFITAFEVYLFEILSRIIYIKPNVLDDSEMKFEAKDIVTGMNTDNFKQWFSNKTTDKTVRNKQHDEIIAKIARIAKCDLTPIINEIKEWNNWTYVRNSIVHSGRRVSTDLKGIWATKFPVVGAKLNIPNNELMKVQTLAMTIAKRLDNRINETIIGFGDASLLSRELFVRKGIDDNKDIKRILQKNLSYKAKKQQIDQALAFQRRSNSAITELDFEGFINEIELQ
jgi:hypothetical protein